MPPDLGPLRDFLRRARTASLLVAASTDDQPLLQRLSLHENVALDFLGVARAAALEAGNLRAYDPGYKPEPGEIVWVPLSDIEGASNLIADLGRIDQAELFAANDEVVRHLRYYAIVVGTGDRQAVFLRHYSPKKELRRHAAFALILSKGAYSRVKEKVFLFDDEVDCFSWDGTLFIKNVTQFQRIFDYFEGLRKKARATLRAIHKRVPIANLEEFETAVTSNSLMLGKLAAIQRKPYLARITITDVERAIQTFKLPVQVVDNGGGKALVYEPSREGRWLILKLLDDDYLDSTMTKEQYEVNSKVRAGS